MTGSPNLTLSIGGDNKTATYSSGNGSSTLIFQYTIQSGETDENGISIDANSIALNSGTIMDAAENIAVITHNSVGDNTGYMVDTTSPTVNTFTISDTKFLVGETASVGLVFSEAVTSFSSSADITTPSGSISTMTSSDNITWNGTFTPTTNTEDSSNVLSLATTYTDLAGNSGPTGTTSNYEVDTLAPTVSSIAITSAEGIQNS